MNAKLRERTRSLYGVAFQQLGLPANLQEKVIDILTQQQQQLEQQAFDAAQSGKLPDPPSPQEMRTQQAQQDNQLRSVLGDVGFAQFKQYQTTIPDRIIINQMSEQGANLSESQSEQLLQVLTSSRDQIFGQPGATLELEFDVSGPGKGRYAAAARSATANRQRPSSEPTRHLNRGKRFKESFRDLVLRGSDFARKAAPRGPRSLGRSLKRLLRS